LRKKKEKNWPKNEYGMCLKNAGKAMGKRRKIGRKLTENWTKIDRKLSEKWSKFDVKIEPSVPKSQKKKRMDKKKSGSGNSGSVNSGRVAVGLAVARWQCMAVAVAGSGCQWLPVAGIVALAVAGSGSSGSGNSGTQWHWQ
jgi:hypothetical protein